MESQFRLYPIEDSKIPGIPEAHSAIINKDGQPRLIQGSYPDGKGILEKLRDIGITHYISLMKKGEKGEKPYHNPDGTVQLNFPIEDYGTTSNEEAFEYCKQIQDLLGNPDVVVYLHCWGGHGRCGTIVSILLAMIFGLSSEEALKRCGELHQQREGTLPIDRATRRPVTSPQNEEQRKQVRDIVDMFQTFSCRDPSLVSEGDIQISFEEGPIELSLEEKSTFVPDAFSCRDSSLIGDEKECVIQESSEQIGPIEPLSKKSKVKY